jgi:predicted transposase YbfD/YdcC
VVEITREVRILRGRDAGKASTERVIYVSSVAMDPAKAKRLLHAIRTYWDIEAGLHQRLDVTAREDASRVRNRNALLVLGIVRRSIMGTFRSWRSQQRNQRQSTLQDFYDTMKKFHGRHAWQKIKPVPS